MTQQRRKRRQQPVEKNGDTSIFASDHHERLAANLARRLIAGIRRLTIVTNKDPHSTKDLTELFFEDLRIRV